MKRMCWILFSVIMCLCKTGLAQFFLVELLTTPESKYNWHDTRALNDLGR